MKQQSDKALTSDRLTKLALSASAAAAILMPQTVTRAVPQLFTRVAPLTAQTLPYCTGVCGSCAGTCIGSLTVITFLTVLTKIKSTQKEAHT